MQQKQHTRNTVTIRNVVGCVREKSRGCVEGAIRPAQQKTPPGHRGGHHSGADGWWMATTRHDTTRTRGKQAARAKQTANKQATPPRLFRKIRGRVFRPRNGRLRKHHHSNGSMARSWSLPSSSGCVSELGRVVVVFVVLLLLLFLLSLVRGVVDCIHPSIHPSTRRRPSHGTPSQRCWCAVVPSSFLF